MSEIINPFKQAKKTDWAKKAEQRLTKSKEETKISNKILEKKPQITQNKSKNITRTAKSFKIYTGEISRTFDKRVNKMQVYFDDKNMPKDFVDSGKYIMFLMSFAEKFKLYELYREVGEKGELDLSEKEVLEFFSN